MVLWNLRASHNDVISITVRSNFATTWLRDISSWPNELRDKMHFVTSVCVKRYVDRHEHMSRSYTSKSRSYRLSRTCVGHEPICREHPTPLLLCLHFIWPIWYGPYHMSLYSHGKWWWLYFKSWTYPESGWNRNGLPEIKLKIVLKIIKYDIISSEEHIVLSLCPL